MRTTTILTAGLVGVTSVAVACVLALGFGVGLTQAASQVWPVAIAAALLAAFMVEADRRASW